MNFVLMTDRCCSIQSAKAVGYDDDDDAFFLPMPKECGAAFVSLVWHAPYIAVPARVDPVKLLACPTFLQQSPLCIVLLCSAAAPLEIDGSSSCLSACSHLLDGLSAQASDKPLNAAEDICRALFRE